MSNFGVSQKEPWPERDCAVHNASCWQQEAFRPCSSLISLFIIRKWTEIRWSTLSEVYFCVVLCSAAAIRWLSTILCFIFFNGESHLLSHDKLKWTLFVRGFCSILGMTESPKSWIFNYRFLCNSLRAGRVRESNPGGGEIFRTRSDRPWGPPSFLYRVCTGSLTG